MVFNSTNGDAILKELYSDDAMKNLTYRDHPWLAMVPKDENFRGDTKVIPVTHGNPQGRSATFSDAVDNKGNSRVVKFNVTHVSNYSLASITNLVIEQSATSEGAFVEALKYEVDNAVNALADDLALDLFTASGGARGQVGSLSGTALTLKNIEDVVNFEVGMELEADTVNGGGTVHTGTATITAIDRDTGTLTSDSNWATQMSSIAADDFLFQEGDYGSKMSGLADWLTTSSSPGALFGVTRTTDVSRLSGIKVQSADVSGLPIEEKLQFALSKAAREGAKSDLILMNFKNFRDLEISLGSKVVYDDVPAGGVVGFRGIKVVGPRGTCDVVPDQSCPDNRIYILQKNTWKLCSAGSAPKILDRDGRLLRESTSDAYEIRIGFYGNLACNAPGWNCVIDNS